MRGTNSGANNWYFTLAILGLKILILQYCIYSKGTHDPILHKELAFYIIAFTCIFTTFARKTHVFFLLISMVSDHRVPYYKLCVTFSDKYGQLNFTHSLGMLGLYSTRFVHAQHTLTTEVSKVYFAVEFISVIETSRFFILEVESRSQTTCTSLQLRLK